MAGSTRERYEEWEKTPSEEILAIEDEELRKADLTPGRELSMDETEQVTGGTFLPNKYENDEYAEAKIPILECASKCISTRIMQEGYGCRPDKRKQGNGKRAYHSEWRLCGTP